MQKYFSGMVINNLTLQSFDKIKKKWIALCSCGNTVAVNSSSLGRNYFCRNCAKGKERPFQWKQNNLGLWKDYYRGYKSSATKRNYEFDLSLDEFRELTTKNCYYCRTEPLRTFEVRVGRSKDKGTRFLLVNGIDRVDNSLGYLKENCVSCCETCNLAKRTLTEQEFLVWIQKVYKVWFNDYPDGEYGQVSGSTEHLK